MGKVAERKSAPRSHAPASERVPRLEPGDHLTRKEFERRYEAMPELKKAELLDGVVFMPVSNVERLEGAPLQAAGAAHVPELQFGDVLTREEFERRYDAMPGLKKAELLEGMVYMPSPVRHRQHAKPQVILLGWLSTYWAATPGVEASDNPSLRMGLKNEPQPDACLFILPECGGQVALDEEGYLEGPPELLVEVSASSAAYDLHIKKRVYLHAGVREYLVWRVEENALDWLVLRKGEYAALRPDRSDVLKSEVFPGLWLDARALLNGDISEVLKTLQAGLASKEHAAFVRKLARTR